MVILLELSELIFRLPKVISDWDKLKVPGATVIGLEIVDVKLFANALKLTLSVKDSIFKSLKWATPLMACTVV